MFNNENLMRLRMSLIADAKCNLLYVLEWLVRLFNLSFDMGVVPMDWRGACIVSLYDGRVTNVNVATREVLVS